MSDQEQPPERIIKAYAKVSDLDKLEQGDIIRFCPDAKPTQIDVANKTGTFDFNEFNIVVLSQSCDIDKNKIERVLLCPIWKINDYFRYLRARYEREPGYKAKFKSDDDFVSKSSSYVIAFRSLVTF